MNDRIMGKRPYNTIFSFNYHNIRHIVKFLEAFKNNYITKRDNVLLDVGAGGSPYFEIFKDVVSRYISVDMKSSLPINETRNIEQIVGTAELLPIESNSIDILLSNQVLEHVMDDRKSCIESYRVLKPNGFFIGSVPHISPIHLEPYDFRRFTFYGIKQLLEESGFKVLIIQGNGGIHKALALSLLMDWYLTTVTENKEQKFNYYLHFYFFGLNGLINLLGIIGDKLLKDKKRSPSNYCWIAIKE